MVRRILPAALAAAILLASLGARAGHGDSTGVDADTIRLGLHVPVTGPAPVDARAVSRGANLYWRYLHDDLGILVHGRRVEVELQDDRSSRSAADQSCDDMAPRSFLLLGFTGVEAILGCSTYAAGNGIPYLTPGHQTADLASRETHFALSATWEQQAPIIAGFIANELGATADVCCGEPPPPPPPPEPECEPILVIPILDIPVPIEQCTEPEPEPQPEPEHVPDGEVRVALVRPSTIPYDDAEDAFAVAMSSLGLPVYVYEHIRGGTGDEATEIAHLMKGHRIDVVVTLSDVPFVTRLARTTANEAHFPRYLMFGMTGGYNGVVAQACGENQLEGASVFSPWPAFSAMSAGEFDPSFAPAAEQYTGEANEAWGGDVLVALWGLMKNIHLMLDALGPHPTREDLLAMLDAGYSHSTGVYPDLSVAADNRFGVDAVHRLEASCEGEPQFHQADSFVTGYPAP